MTLAAIPSPSRGVVHLGPVPLRGYALMIIIGIAVAVWLSDRRLRARGQQRGLAADLATWSVPFGIVGARLYSVVTTPGPYFGAHGDPVRAFEIWKGGLGIWGAVAGGAVGAYLCARRRGVPFALVADACAPGIVLAQAIGRWGNWFNQELYGRPTNLPWAVEISPDKRVYPNIGHYQPTFLYECLWDVGVAAVLLAVDRRHRLGRGKLFALYVMLYTAGRAWVEALRIDEAEHFLGVRLNDWVCLAVFLGAGAALLFTHGRVDPDVPEGADPAEGGQAGAAAGTAATGTAAAGGTAQGGTAEGGGEPRGTEPSLHAAPAGAVSEPAPSDAGPAPGSGSG